MSHAQFASPDITPKRRQRIDQEVDAFFHPSNRIVPSPWSRSRTLPPPLLSPLRRSPGLQASPLRSAGESPRGSSAARRDMGCQTTVSCPPHMTLEEMFAGLMAAPARCSTDTVEDTNNSSLRRRLFEDAQAAESAAAAAAAAPLALNDDDGDDDDDDLMAPESSVIVVSPILADRRPAFLVHQGSGAEADEDEDAEEDDELDSIRSPATLESPDASPILSASTPMGRMPRTEPVAAFMLPTTPPAHPRRPVDRLPVLGPASADVVPPPARARPAAPPTTTRPPPANPSAAFPSAGPAAAPAMPSPVASSSMYINDSEASLLPAPRPATSSFSNGPRRPSTSYHHHNDASYDQRFAAPWAQRRPATAATSSFVHEADSALGLSAADHTNSTTGTEHYLRQRVSPRRTQIIEDMVQALMPPRRSLSASTLMRDLPLASSPTHASRRPWTASTPTSRPSLDELVDRVLGSPHRRSSIER